MGTNTPLYNAIWRPQINSPSCLKRYWVSWAQPASASQRDASQEPTPLGSRSSFKGGFGIFCIPGFHRASRNGREWDTSKWRHCNVPTSTAACTPSPRQLIPIPGIAHLFPQQTWLLTTQYTFFIYVLEETVYLNFSLKTRLGKKKCLHNHRSFNKLHYTRKAWRKAKSNYILWHCGWLFSLLRFASCLISYSVSTCYRVLTV